MSEHLTDQKIADTQYSVTEVVRERWSPRAFAKTPVTDEQMHQLFEAVRWAASSNNGQPWRFIYAHKDSDTYAKMVDCLSDFNQKWATNAPVLLLAGYKKQFDNGKENFHALHDLGLGLGNMTVQAENMGIALHHMAGLDWQKAHKVFDVPEGYHLATAIAIGYYPTQNDLDQLSEDLKEMEVKARERMPQSDFVFKKQFGN